MKTAAFVSAAFFLLAILPARAATLSTLMLTDAGYDIVSWNTWKGQAFRLGAESPASQVDSLTLKLEVVVPNASMVLRIVGNTPGSNTPDITDVRGEFRPSVPMNAGTVVVLMTFDRDTQQTFPPLETGATYWLVAGMSAADDDQAQPAGMVRWHYAGTHPSAPASAQQWTVGPQVAVSGTAGGGWTSSTETPFLFDLTATAVPEPGVTFLAAAAGLFFNRRRRA
jgi:hypothetical protein